MIFLREVTILFTSSSFGLAPRPYFVPYPGLAPAPGGLPYPPQDAWVSAPHFPVPEFCPQFMPRFVAPPPYHFPPYPSQVWNSPPGLPGSLNLPLSSFPSQNFWLDSILAGRGTVWSPSSTFSSSQPKEAETKEAEKSPSELAAEKHQAFLDERDRIHQANMQRVNEEGLTFQNSFNGWRSMDNWWAPPRQESEEQKARNRYGL